MGQGRVEFYARPVPKPNEDLAGGDRTLVRSLEEHEQRAIDAAKQDCADSEGMTRKPESKECKHCGGCGEVPWEGLYSTFRYECFKCGGTGTRQGDESESSNKREQPDTRDEDLERQRMMLVDGFPGEWLWEGGEWRLLLLDDGWSYPINALIHGEDGTAVVGSIVTGSARDGHQLPNTQVLGDTFYEVARALKSKAERLVACLEGLDDE
jgi:hypothetical protein